MDGNFFNNFSSSSNPGEMLDRLLGSQGKQHPFSKNTTVLSPFVQGYLVINIEKNSGFVTAGEKPEILRLKLNDLEKKHEVSKISK